MKMETVVRAPRSGTISELFAVEGRPVLGHDLLLVISDAS